MYKESVNVDETNDQYNVEIECPHCGEVHVGLPTKHNLCLECWEHLGEFFPGTLEWYENN